jgi:hypothetical protein
MAHTSRESALEAALFRLSERWRFDIGRDCWTAKRFRQMIDSSSSNYRGGIWTVRHLLYTGSTSGFRQLRKHPELTVEAFVLNGEWNDLFDEYDRQTAKRKLAEE